MVPSQQPHGQAIVSRLIYARNDAYDGIKECTNPPNCGCWGCRPSYGLSVSCEAIKRTAKLLPKVVCCKLNGGLWHKEAVPTAAMGQAVAGYLFGEAGFSLPRGGRSGLPAGAHLDHPGVWEDARLGKDANAVAVTCVMTSLCHVW